MKGIVQPRLETQRLVMRPFRLADADAVSGLANDEGVARNTLNIPYPYARDDAVAWITSHADQLERREAVTYAVTERGLDRVVGAVGLILELEHARAELGYWLGRPYWGRGYATEAARAVVWWGFETFDLHRVHASHFPRNPASGRVLRKLGMRHEGRLREHVLKWGEYLDLERYGMLRDDLGLARTAPTAATGA
ncbi:MAG: GNAT family N-acetyltransferase [Gemmatimonadota bacterium]